IAGYREMEALAIESKDEGMRLTAIILLAKVYATPSSVHDADNVQALSDQALELSIKTNDKEAQARIYWILCLVTARNGKFIESIIHGEKALELARELGNDELLAYTLHDLSQSYGGIYQLEKGYEALRESQSLWHKLGNLVMLVDNLSTMLIFDYFEGEYDQAIMNYKEAAVLSESIGNLWGQAYCRMYIGSIYIDRGQIEEGIQIMKKCLVLAKEAGFIVPLLQTQAELGLVYAYLGDSERGLDTIDIALKFSDQEITGWKSWVKAIKARVFIQLNELEKSRALLHSAELDLQEGDPLGFARVYFRAVHCELALAEKDYPKALELSQLFEEDILSDVLMLVPWLYYLRGVILLKVGQIQEAQMVLDKAINTAEKMQMRRMIWQIQIVLADLADLQGEVEQARQLRNQAKATINYIAERIGSEDLRKSFMDRPDVIALWETK
ncbi:MAG TPA: hypothetical protein VLA49_18760, partial [Anaerolineales bacterium]|nr:hypothetical protein [Anaerolineales bacterium]